MSTFQGRIRYVVRNPKYETEKPYVLAIPEGTVDLEKFTVTNLEYEEKLVDFVDVRPALADFTLQTSGFQFFSHKSKYSRVSATELDGYQRETEDVLKKLLDAEEVVCYEFRSRKNIPYNQDTLDLKDPLQYLQLATDVHTDYTFVSGPITTKRVLKENNLEHYMKPGYRFRLVNTWRSAIPKITDMPLAFCDFRNVETGDVIAGDRVRPDATGEIFHGHFNPNHKWYFLDFMTRDEPVVFVNYDSMAGNQARFCPHASFHPEGRDAGYRESYETRSLVITKL